MGPGVRPIPASHSFVDDGAVNVLPARSSAVKSRPLQQRNPGRPEVAGADGAQSRPGWADPLTGGSGPVHRKLEGGVVAFERSIADFTGGCDSRQASARDQNLLEECILRRAGRILSIAPASAAA